MTSQVAEWIEKLDLMTADEIARLFREENVTGLVGFTDECPIANFLKTKGNALNVYVGGTTIQWSEVVPGDDRMAYVERSARCVGGVPDFVRAFDGGAYPDLYRWCNQRNEHTIYDEVLSAMKSKVTAGTLAQLANPA